jgi:bifunctional DNA-binding transcriptional regulator/antitoxin component of YhaV-PrlF toxin-antitoxin module
MDTTILNLQSKGQIMLPKKWRDQFGTTTFKAVKKGGMVILYPVKINLDPEREKMIDQIMEEDKDLLRSLADK